MTTIERLTSRHVATREAPDRHQIKRLEMIAIIQYASDSRDCTQSRSVDLHQTDAMGAPCGSRSNLHPTATMKRDMPLFVMIPGASDFNPTAHTDHGRTPRSRSDRTAIAVRSSRDRRVDVVESPPVDPTAIDGRPGPRSWPDRGTIVTRSRPDRGPIVAKMVAIWSKFEAKFTANMGASNPPQGIAPTTLQNRSHDCLYRPRFRANFPL